jgi:hypothetical protein
MQVLGLWVRGEHTWWVAAMQSRAQRGRANSRSEVRKQICMWMREWHQLISNNTMSERRGWGRLGKSSHGTCLLLVMYSLRGMVRITRFAPGLPANPRFNAVSDRRTWRTAHWPGVAGTRLTRRFTSRSIHGCGRSTWSRGKEHGSELTCPSPSHSPYIALVAHPSTPIGYLLRAPPPP